MSIFSYNNKIFAYNNKIFKTNWKPNQISDMIFWSDANSRNIIKDSYNRVSYWKDNSGLMNHSAQSLNSKKPLLVENVKNGHPSLYFQSDKFLQMTLNINYFTIFSVISTTNNNYIYSYGDDDTGFYLNGDTNVLKVSNSGTTSTKNYTNNWLSGSWKILIHQYNGTNLSHKLIINKENINLTNVSTDNPGILSQNIFKLGSKDNYGISGYIPEFMIFNRSLELSEMFQISDWLNDKYEIY